ncbi:MAG: tRNA (adenosine(37)-N6)-threonylcarbamoyltransferase complex ATPase subunit type 1 TsaE [Flavobacteriaceae bacterium]|nr:tRNA (adenosine(37)-N6)-threonylcarbamoyltransferase complex ATPase subunit type 1 TsaE [Flavobacteriaceae bacterium]
MKKIFKLENIDQIAQELKEMFSRKIVLFNGEMGAGKTTLISAIVRALGNSEETSSPTFSIVNEYKFANGYVYHFDFYRIKNHYEALDIGIDDYFCSGYWNFIEWPEKITNLLPEEVMVVNLEIISTTERSIECFESEVL